jgi:hypothetical protein
MPIEEIDREVKAVRAERRQRAGVDTNVLLSGLFWRGAPDALIERVRDGALTMISSPALLAELADVLNRPKYNGTGRRWSASTAPPHHKNNTRPRAARHRCGAAPMWRAGQKSDAFISNHLLRDGVRAGLSLRPANGRSLRENASSYLD